MAHRAAAPARGASRPEAHGDRGHARRGPPVRWGPPGARGGAHPNWRGDRSETPIWRRRLLRRPPWFPTVRSFSWSSRAQPLSRSSRVARASSPVFDNGDDASGGSSGGGSGQDATTGGSSSGGPVSVDDAGLVTYDGPPPNVDGGMLACSTPNGLSVKFNPVYSGFDGTHSYQVPVFVEGVDPSTVTWGASDPSYVSLQPYVIGVMITTKKAGEVDIVASAGGKCGTTHLTITQYQASDWTTGNARYNNGTPRTSTSSPCPPHWRPWSPTVGSRRPTARRTTLPPSAPRRTSRASRTPSRVRRPRSARTATVPAPTAPSSGRRSSPTSSTPPSRRADSATTSSPTCSSTASSPTAGTSRRRSRRSASGRGWHQWQDIDSGAAQAGMRSYLRALPPLEQTGCFDLLNMPMCADGGN